MFGPRFRSEIVDPLNVPTDLPRVETFPGTACLMKFAVMRAAETNVVGPLSTIQSGSPPAGRSLDPASPGSYH